MGLALLAFGANNSLKTAAETVVINTNDGRKPLNNGTLVQSGVNVRLSSGRSGVQIPYVPPLLLNSIYRLVHRKIECENS